MGKQVPRVRHRKPSTTEVSVAEDLAVVPTCDFGYDVPSDFEDEEINEAEAFQSDEHSDLDHDWVTSSSRDTIGHEDVEKELRRESKRTGLQLLDLSDLISDDDDQAVAIKSASSVTQEHAGDSEESNSDHTPDDVSSQDGANSDMDDHADDETDADEYDKEQDSDAGSIEEDDVDDPDAHAAVLSVIDQLSRRDDVRLRRNADQLLQKTGNIRMQDAGALTIETLLEPIQASGSALADVESTFEQVSAGAKNKVADVPMETFDRKRLERSAGLQRTREEMDKWAHLVQANRKAEQLSFPLNNERHIESSASLVAKFRPTNSLEQDLKELTQLYRQTEKQLNRGEELEENIRGSEEVERRQAQIAKMRSLLFYHELRAKRIKKIKSKAFRKHLKKSLLKSENDHDQDEETQQEQEKRELERINARMSLRIKNTSKWMKSALRHGGLVDSEVKEQVADQQRNVEALRSRMNTLKDAECSSGSDSDGHEIEAAELAREIDNDQPNQRKGVYGLKFMVRAAEQQKARAQEMMREFEQAAAGSETDADKDKAIDFKQTSIEGAGLGRKSFGPGSTVLTATDANSTQQVKLMPNSLQIEQVGFTSAGFRSSVSGNLACPSKTLSSKETSVSEDTDCDPSLSNSAAASAVVVSAPSDDKPVVYEAPAMSTSTGESKTKSKRHKKAKKANKEEQPASVDDPWKHGNSAAKAIVKSSVKLMEIAVPSDNIDENAFNLVPAFASQEHRVLVKAAFTTAGDEVEEFLAEKQAIVEEDLPEEPIVEMPGWGSWSGAGLQPSRAAKRRAAGRAAEQAARKKVAIGKRKDGSMSHVIINEKPDKKLQKYQLRSVPFPYSSAELYERSLQTPLGSEWHSQSAYSDLIQPTIKCKMGHSIDPIEYSKPLKKQQRKPQTKVKRVWMKSDA